MIKLALTLIACAVIVIALYVCALWEIASTFSDLHDDEEDDQ